MSDGVPSEHQQAAEEIRSHLVALRGGAPFLSPDDASVLVGWLEEGRSVASILRAMERAAEARRTSRRRTPLTLRQARRHLERPTRGALPEPPPPPADLPHPLGPLAVAIEAQAATDDRGLALKMLAAELVCLPDDDPEALLRAALGCFRAFHAAAWEDLGQDEQDRRREIALDALAATHPDLDEARLAALADESARDALRRAYPLLTAATLWDLLER